MTSSKNLLGFLSPLDVEDFFLRIWEKEYFVFDKHDFIIPFNTADFEKLLSFGNLSYPQVRCYDSSKIISPEFYTASNINSISDKINPEHVTNLLHDNKTVRIADLPSIHPEISNFAEQLSHFFGCEVNINAYFSRGACSGLAGHYDPHHIFAFQLFGEKTWNIGNIVVDTPTKKYSPKPLKTPEVNVQLTTKSGEMLYLPPGMWHSTFTKESSLHITIGIHPPRWIEKLNQLLEYALIKHPIIRASVPMSINKGLCLYDNDINADLKSLVKILEIEANNISISNNYNSKIKKQVTIPKTPALICEEDVLSNVSYEGVDSLINDIWNLSNCPLSIYFRGSFPKKDSVYIPWDLDVYLIVNDKEKTLDNIENICNSLTKSYPMLPRIDLSIVSKFEILSSEFHILKRLLLIHDSVLVKGEPLKGKIVCPPLDCKTAIAVKTSMLPFLEKKLVSIKNICAENNIVSTEPIDSYTKTIAKAVLRAGVFIGIKNQCLFSREIKFCYKNIIEEFPETEKYTSIMMGKINGEHYDINEFINAAENLKNTIYYGL